MKLVSLPSSMGESLQQELLYANLAPQVSALLQVAEKQAPTLRDLRVFVISSTAKGGGVAEMLPRFLSSCRYVGLESYWLILDVPDADLKKRFFAFTKTVHNAVHGVPSELFGGVAGGAAGGPAEGAAGAAAATREEQLQEAKALFDAVCEWNAERLLEAFDLRPENDLIIIHDPQPLGMARHLQARMPGLRCLWRCHIGLDKRTAATEQVWQFLEGYLTDYAQCVFSAPEYVRDCVRQRSVIISPGVSPLSAKCRELSSFEQYQTLLRAGLLPCAQSAMAVAAGGQSGAAAGSMAAAAAESWPIFTVDPPFKHKAVIYTPRSSREKSMASMWQRIREETLQHGLQHVRTDAPQPAEGVLAGERGVQRGAGGSGAPPTAAGTQQAANEGAAGVGNVESSAAGRRGEGSLVEAVLAAFPHSQARQGQAAGQQEEERGERKRAPLAVRSPASDSGSVSLSSVGSEEEEEEEQEQAVRRKLASEGSRQQQRVESPPQSGERPSARLAACLPAAVSSSLPIVTVAAQGHLASNEEQGLLEASAAALDALSPESEPLTGPPSPAVTLEAMRHRALSPPASRGLSKTALARVAVKKEEGGPGGKRDERAGTSAAASAPLATHSQGQSRHAAASVPTSSASQSVGLGASAAAAATGTATSSSSSSSISAEVSRKAAEVRSRLGLPASPASASPGSTATPRFPKAALPVVSSQGPSPAEEAVQLEDGNHEEEEEEEEEVEELELEEEEEEGAKPLSHLYGSSSHYRQGKLAGSSAAQAPAAAATAATAGPSTAAAPSQSKATPSYSALLSSSHREQQQQHEAQLHADLLSCPFFSRPIVTQVSRFDRLKGFMPLLEAFVHLKRNQDYYSSRLDPGYSAAAAAAGLASSHHPHHHKRMLRAAVLVLAGPDPSFVADDPEAQAVLQDLQSYYDRLPTELQRDIKIICLPMQDLEQNHLIVNSIQRASSVIVQNSLQEGFGLTVTEAMFKRVAVVGTEQAVGLRTQIVDGVSGLLIKGDAGDFRNVAEAVNTALGDKQLRERLAVNGQKRAFNKYLVYQQLELWLALVVKLMRPDLSAAEQQQGQQGQKEQQQLHEGEVGGGRGSSVTAASAATAGSFADRCEASSQPVLLAPDPFASLKEAQQLAQLSPRRLQRMRDQEQQQEQQQLMLLAGMSRGSSRVGGGRREGEEVAGTLAGASTAAQVSHSADMPAAGAPQKSSTGLQQEHAEQQLPQSQAPLHPNLQLQMLQQQQTRGGGGATGQQEA